MRRALLLIAVSGLISGCAAPPQVQNMSSTYEFENYRVGVALQSADRGCALLGAVLENKSDHPLNYVYTRLLSASAEGVTISDIGINFPPTVKGGVTKAVHQDSNMVALVPCTAIQASMRGSGG